MQCLNGKKDKVLYWEQGGDLKSRNLGKLCLCLGLVQPLIYKNSASTVFCDCRREYFSQKLQSNRQDIMQISDAKMHSVQLQFITKTKQKNSIRDQ